MTAPGRIAALRRPPGSPGEEHALDRDQVVIGKDVLELVSSAMYVDPMTVYREYVQNAADAVDAARASGVLGPSDPGTVNIDVDAARRTVVVRDNGIGVPWREFPRRLTALGGSGKRGTGARGFRGVGRLAGLGYAQELVFRSRVDGEILVSEMVWDCRKLRAALREQGPGDIVDLIRSVVVVRRVAMPDHPDRFFEVELRGVVRSRTDKLMNPAAIADYLSQVAPVPFADEFRFGAEIAAVIRSFVGLAELDIRVSGIEGPVRRPHRDQFPIDDVRTSRFEGLEFVEVPAVDGGVAAVAWVLHHEYEGAIPAGASIKGLRMRAGNIQVGDQALLEDLFPETRFNSWSVGEVHVLDRRIVPNGRRDHFEIGSHFHNLTNHLSPLARDIARRCRTGSVRRKLLREFALHGEVASDRIGIVEQGGIGGQERQAVSLTVEQSLLQMEKIAGMDLLLDDAPTELVARVGELRGRLATAMSEATPANSPLARLPAEKREMYEHLIELVYECSTNRLAAKALVDRILLKIS